MPVVKTRYFKEAFESALNQVYDNYEIVVIDNLADGDLRWVIDSPRVKLVTNEKRLKPGKNWNLGIESCRGEWVVLLSDDDLLLPTALDSVNRYLQKSKESVDVIRTLRETISTDGEFIAYTCPGKNVETLPEYIYNQFNYNRGQVISDVFFNRNVAMQVGGFKELAYAWGMDHYFLIEVAGVKNKVGLVNDVCMKYRMHSDNISSILSIDVCLAKMGADDCWSMSTQSLLARSASDDYKNPALKIMKKHRQSMQDGHYAAMAIANGLFALYRLNKLNNTTLGSKRRSFAKGVVAWTGRRFK